MTDDDSLGGGQELVVRPVGPGEQLQDKPTWEQRIRESLRGIIATWLLLILTWLAVAPVVGLFGHVAPTEDIVKVVQLVLTPVVGLVGAVTGFYYGVQAKSG
jgi:hypothetical protein